MRWSNHIVGSVIYDLLDILGFDLNFCFRTNILLCFKALKDLYGIYVVLYVFWGKKKNENKFLRSKSSNLDFSATLEI